MTNRRTHRHLLFPLLPLLAGGLGCSTTGTPEGRSGSGVARAETAVAKALVSDDQENQIGQQVQGELQKQGAKLSNDPEVVGYVSAIAAPILEQAKKDRPGVTWQIHVIDDPKTVNAFSTPGGHLYVYTGLLLTAGDDAEIAGVMAHEAGHEAARHVARSLVEANGLEAVAALAMGRNPNLATQLATSVVGKGVLLAHSRGEETEADEYGARYSAASGYDPNALISFFQKLQQQEGRVPRAFGWISDHPLTADRISHLQAYIAANHLSGGKRDSAQLSRVKARLGGGQPVADSRG